MAETEQLDLTKPTFEDVLRQVGKVGQFQLTQISLGIIGLALTSFMTLSFVFLGHEPPHVCNKINESQFLVSRGLLNETTTFSYESCDIRISTNQNGSDNDITKMTCPNGRNFSKAKHTTFPSEWDLVCESKGVAEISYTLFTAGQIVGGVFASVIADRFGRKPIFMAMAFFAFLFEAAVTFSTSIYMVSALWFFCGMCRQGFNEVFFVHGIEFLLPRQRQVYGVVVCVFWVVYLLLLGGVAYIFQDSSWRYTQGTVAGIGMFFILHPFFLLESPRWLATNKRYDDALLILKKGCKQNKADFEKLKTVFEAFVKCESAKKEKQVFLRNHDLDDDQVEIAEVQGSARKESIFTLLRYRKTLIIFLIVSYTWFTHNMTYYGLFMTSSKLAGNRFINYCLMSLVELPCNPLILYMMGKFSRRFVLNIFLGLASLSLFLSSILAIFGESLEYSGTAFTALFIMGKFFISASYNVVYIWTPEIFPTNVRSTACAITTCAARISSLAVAYLRPLISVIAWGPGMIFTIFCLVNLFLTHFLPDTKDKDLHNNVEDMNNDLGQKAKKNNTEHICNICKSLTPGHGVPQCKHIDSGPVV